MMPAKSATDFGFTRGKLALVMLLSTALVGTLVVQFSGDSPAPIVPRKRAAANAHASAEPSGPEAINDSMGVRAAAGRWPELSVDEVAEFDPFAFPEALALRRLQSANAQSLLQPSNSKKGQSASADYSGHALSKGSHSPDQDGGDSRPHEAKRRLEEQRAVASELQRRGVDVILRTENGSVAHIGDLEVRVGDVLNGLRVAEIGRDGIRLVAEPSDLSDSANEQ